MPSQLSALVSLTSFHVITQFGASIVKVVTIHIKASPYTCRIALCTIIDIGLKDTVDDTLLCGSRGAWFIIIVHKLYRPPSPAYPPLVGLIIEYIVAQIGGSSSIFPMDRLPSRRECGYCDEPADYGENLLPHLPKWLHIRGFL